MGFLAISGPAIAQDPGEQISVDPAVMSAPFATPSASNSPDAAPLPEGMPLRVPKGFHANRFADRLDYARWLAIAPNGDVFLAESRAGKITVLRDANGDGAAETRATFATGLAQPWRGISRRPALRRGHRSSLAIPLALRPA